MNCTAGKISFCQQEKAFLKFLQERNTNSRKQNFKEKFISENIFGKTNIY